MRLRVIGFRQERRAEWARKKPYSRLFRDERNELFARWTFKKLYQRACLHEKSGPIRFR